MLKMIQMQPQNAEEQLLAAHATTDTWPWPSLTRILVVGTDYIS